MKKIIFCTIAFGILGISTLNAKTVTVHEAVETLNKTTTMLVTDYGKMNDRLKQLDERLRLMEQEKMKVKENNKDEIEIDKKILEYIKH
jgi:hypothetical protein